MNFFDFLNINEFLFNTFNFILSVKTQKRHQNNNKKVFFRGHFKAFI